MFLKQAKVKALDKLN